MQEQEHGSVLMNWLNDEEKTLVLLTVFSSVFVYDKLK